MSEEGWVEYKEGQISKVAGLKGESVVSCRVVKDGECEGSTVEVEATGLPWNTELVDEPIKNEKGEVVREEVRDRFYKSAGPGWVLKCKSSEFGTKGIATDTCVGETSGNVENVAAGVPVEFDAKSPHLVCSGSSGKEKVGVVEGALVFASTTEGSTLSVFGAKTGPLPPAVVTSAATSVTSTGATLNGVVAPKGAETTYHFEYGTSTTYGKRVPLTEEVKVGSGRLPVAESQTLSGLETSTLYHYRITATNSGGTSYGEDKTFTTGYPAKWQLNGKETYTKTKAEGTLLLEDKGLRVTAECGMSEEGWVEYKEGQISKVAGLKGESVVSCRVVKDGECEGSTVEVEATGLPWNTELVDEPIKKEKGEVVREEVRDRFYKSAGPGWVLKCKSSEFGTKGIATDTCVGETSGNVENVAAGVPVEFDAKSPHLVCSGSSGKEKVGVVEGALVFASTTEGSTLSVFGAKAGPLPPAVVTSAATSVTSTGATLNGVVAPKGAETTYHFEYGTSTTYGKRVPLTEEVKVGSGGLPVAESQTLSGLETSTLYHYRITATNSGGTSYGEDKTFTTGYPAKWLYNGKEAEGRKTKAEGTLILEDGGVGVAVECTVSETGEIYFGKEGIISKVTNAKGESKFTCHTIKQGFCGEASVEVEPTNLPWKTELIDAPIENEKGEVVRYEPRERFYGSSMPGWQLELQSVRKHRY